MGDIIDFDRISAKQPQPDERLILAIYHTLNATGKGAALAALKGLAKCGEFDRTRAEGGTQCE